jgi:hypothetical protein
MPSRIVEIQRLPVGRQDRVYSDSKKSIGSVMTRTGETATGLTFDEIRKYMPGLVSADHTEFNFRAKVDNYFRALTLRVTKAQPLVFEIGTDNEGNPLNVTDYVHYKFALQNPKVAKSPEEILHGVSMFFVVDKEKELSDNHQKLEKRREAYKEFILLLEDPKKLEVVLTLLASELKFSISEVKNADPREVKIRLEKYVQDNPEKFYNVVKDKHILTKAFIEHCVSAGVLNRIGTSILNGDEKIGNTVEEAVLYLTDKANSEVFVTLKTRVAEFKKIN